MSSLGLLTDPVLNQLRQCALTGVEVSLVGQGCNNDGCICQQEYLPAVVTAVSTAVQGQCSNSNTIDAFDAMAAVISYCTAHGFHAPALLASITTPTVNTQTISLLDSTELANLPMCAAGPIGYAYGSAGCGTNNCFCRPDVLASVLDDVSTSASAACSGVAAAGVNSALAAVLIYCSRAGFAISTTFSSEPTGTITGFGTGQTATVSAIVSFSVLPGGSTSISFPTSSPSTNPTPSSSNLQIILPVTIGCLTILSGIVIFFCWRRKRSDKQNSTAGNSMVDYHAPGGFFGHSQNVTISNSQFLSVGRDQVRQGQLPHSGSVFRGM